MVVLLWVVIRQSVCGQSCVLPCVKSPRTSGAKCGGKLGDSASFKHGDYIVNGRAAEQRETCRSHVYGALGVIKRIGFISATGGEGCCELRGILSHGQFGENPSPILF